MKYILRRATYQQPIPATGRYIVAGDIGGTNSNFGFFLQNDESYQLLFSFHAKSQEVVDFAALIAQVCDQAQTDFGATVTAACIGAAGVVHYNRTYVKPTNLPVAIDAEAIKQVTGLSRVILINDFEAVGLGLEAINSESIVSVNKGKLFDNGQKACIGAGTGMGKSGLLWNAHFRRYLPLASEGGHADCAAQTSQESALFDFIQKHGKRQEPISWEDVLAGQGIKYIYQFLGTQHAYSETAISKEIAATGFGPDFISRYAKSDKRCADTFNLYTIFYARCAKNFVLDMLALNGIYIAGGIAAKNIDLFQSPLFMEEFTRSCRYRELLLQVPVFVVTDYNVSLYGARVFLTLQQQGIV